MRAIAAPVGLVDGQLQLAAAPVVGERALHDGGQLGLRLEVEQRACVLARERVRAHEPPIAVEDEHRVRNGGHERVAPGSCFRELGAGHALAQPAG